MISTLRVKNFKSWEELGPLRFAPLTAFFGANSSGKTSILQSMLLLKQTAESTDRRIALLTGDNTSLVDLGVFADLIHRRSNQGEVVFDITWRIAEPIESVHLSEEMRKQISELRLETVVREVDGVPTVGSFRYYVGEDYVGVDRKADKKRTSYELKHRGLPATRTQGKPWDLGPPTKCYGFPEDLNQKYQNLSYAQEFVYLFERQMRNISYLGPLREYPRRNYIWSGDTPQDVGRRGADAITALVASRSRGPFIQSKKRARKKGLEEQVAYWLKELGMIESFELRQMSDDKKQYQVKVKKSAQSEEVLITDVGFGVSQVLPIITLCYFVPEGSVVFLEQPEIHLHPSVQQGLADVLIHAIQSRNIQIIVESHSEHFLRRLQRRIAEDRISRDNCALYFCEYMRGRSEITPLQIDLLGSIVNWPKDFFGDVHQDVIAMAEEQMRRSEANAG